MGKLHLHCIILYSVGREEAEWEQKKKSRVSKRVSSIPFWKQEWHRYREREGRFNQRVNNNLDRVEGKEKENEPGGKACINEQQTSGLDKRQRWIKDLK